MDHREFSTIDGLDEFKAHLDSLRSNPQEKLDQGLADRIYLQLQRTSHHHAFNAWIHCVLGSET